MRRRILSAMAITAFAVLVPVAAAAGATEHTSALEAPRAAGLMPAAEAPSPEPSPAAPVLQIAGLVLLLSGGVVVARSWVSPAEPV